MKKFFTLIATVAIAASMNAQTEWNFSNWDANTYNETFTKDGLTLSIYNPQNEMLTFCKTKRSNSKTKRYYFRPPLQLYDNSVKTDFLSDFNAIIFEKL